MGEREIKVGQVWRNCIAEVEVTFRDVSYYYPKIRTTFSGGLTDEMDERVFRATHEWVRDPAPEIKEGDWVELGGSNVGKWEVRSIDDFGVVWVSGPNLTGMFAPSTFTACDPPPLHAALRAAAAREPYPGHCEAERVLNEIAALYRKGER